MKNIVNTNSISGTINITDDTLCTIVAATTITVPGVVGMSSNAVEGFTNLLGFKNYTQGVKIVSRKGLNLSFSVYITAIHGYRIPEVALKIQEKIKTAIEFYTNFIVTSVNVYVQDLIFEDNINSSDNIYNISTEMEK